MVRAMTVFRLVPLQIHSALEMLAGLLLMAAPFALGLSSAAMVSGVAIGALVVGLALQALDLGSGASLSVSAHWAADLGLVLGLAGASLILGTIDQTASMLFGGFALALLLLHVTTRYSQR